jgi:hypothetical protein
VVVWKGYDEKLENCDEVEFVVAGYGNVDDPKLVTGGDTYFCC